MDQPIAALENDPASLPIAQARQEILDLLKDKDFLVVVGDTGSGKTTQLPAFLVAADDAREDKSAEVFAPVAITQPRRVAATSVSQRVADERGVALGGDDVGYKVRFDTAVGAGCRLTFMTDGVLVRECVGDGSLRRYNTVMLDEAHERSVDTDVLFGLIKRAVELRRTKGPRLRCVIASATLDAQRFSEYFDGAPVVRVPGRSYPVDVYHSKQAQPMTRYGPASRAYVKASVDVAVQIHRSQPPGHVLIFLTGQDEIEEACASLRAQAAELEDGVFSGVRRGPAMLVLPLYGALPSEMANRVFGAVDATEIRKVVVATNIAETSLTVPGIKYVVDPGYVKQKGYDPARAVASLVVVPVSKVAAEQRAGRAGRTEPGQCYRLYSKACFEGMQPETIPEIRRSSMASVALALKSLRVQDVLGFDFLDAPDEAQLACALLELHALGALDASRGGALTAAGDAMASLALEPDLARALLEAVHFGDDPKRRGRADATTRDAVLAIAAMLSAEDVWYVGGDARDRRGGPSSRRDAADALRDQSLDEHARFRHARGDLVSLLNVYVAYERACRSGGQQSFARRHSLRDRALRFARKARDQLDSELARAERNDRRRKEQRGDKRPRDDAERAGGRVDLDAVARALCAGLCCNAAERTMNDAYLLMPSAGASLLAASDATKLPPTLVRLDAVTVAPMTRNPDWICFHELRVNRRAKGSFARNVVVVDGEWLKHCRRRIGTTEVEILCGHEPLPKPEPEEEKTPKVNKDALLKLAAIGADDATASTASTKPATSAVDEARARFLARKKKSGKK
mmetsp:Transcript_21277/g.63538  ORF Transcript_21277/g.63538 Transcript_21277/m.63538 type:complete len:804 (+) Transcript_21277:257-2668(+)